MTYKRNRLSRQLLALIVIVFAIVFIGLGLILPQMLIPVAEQNIYNRLKEPLEIIRSDDKDYLNTNVGYIYIVNDEVIASENIHSIIKIKNIKKILNKINSTQGKFRFDNQNYYYYKIEKNGVVKVALTDDTYIKEAKDNILTAILPVVLFTFAIIGLILLCWSSIIVKKIERLKSKVDNIDNDDYNHNIDFKIDDEIRSLGLAIEDMRITLKETEEYRNQMYQNISHDFKTPLTVIKSYVEAVDDGIENPKESLKVIKEQTEKLENKVHSLLYLNKLDYLKDTEDIDIKPIDMKKLLQDEIEKFKFQRKDLKFILETDKKSVYYGTLDHWETILDNLLSNFIRYADKTIKITAKNNRLILYNDGSKIDSLLLEGIFTPFRKGIKGQFGLGLSIVKKTVQLLGYDVVVKNEKKGVSFIISRDSK